MPAKINLLPSDKAVKTRTSKLVSPIKRLNIVLLVLIIAGGAITAAVLADMGAKIAEQKGKQQTTTQAIRSLQNVEQRAVLLKDRLTLAKQLYINKDADVQYGKLSTIVSAIPTEVQPINLEGNDAQIESSFSIRTPQDLSTFIQLMQSSTE